METNHTNNGDKMNIAALEAFLSRHINTSHSTSERRVSVIPADDTLSVFAEDLVRDFDVYGRALPTRRCFVREQITVPLTVDALCVLNESTAVFAY